MHALTTLLCLALMCVVPLHGFYMPGVDMRDFAKGDMVPLKVNKLTSKHTQLPYAYYSLPFCKPKKEKMEGENIGEKIRGDRIENSLYEIPALEEISCRPINAHKDVADSKACTTYDKSHLKKFQDKINQEYTVQWIMDNLPAAQVKTKADSTKRYEPGYPLGLKRGADDCINNHVDINVVYAKSHRDETKVVIIGFEVSPRSVKYNMEKWNSMKATDQATTCPERTEDYMCLTSDTADILWTYSLKWEETKDIKWTERWDVYLENTDAQIHWFSIINSLMIVLFLTGMVAMIMMRTLRADLGRYNANNMEQNDEEAETGWKLVHGDVFRPPAHPMALAVLIGSGVQVFGMTVITLAFAVLGFLSPAQRGWLVTAFVVLFVVMGVFAGYFSTRCYKTFKGLHWKKNTVATAFAFPGVIFTIFFFLNMCEVAVKSSGAVSVGTFFSLIALWFFISVPLVFFGSYFAFRKPLAQDPVRTNQIPRQVPEQVWYMSPLLSILMGGILPFGAVFIELFFILSSLWENQLYYIFGFLFIVFVILVITCAEITVVMCYFQLCAEDYHWWWRSFLTSGASALYLFLYSIFYFVTTLELDLFVSKLLYFGYTTIMSIAFFVLTGTIGFYACFFFVRKIYSSIHVD
jgi:transmembrane 9 superfamily protein 2/4